MAPPWTIAIVACALALLTACGSENGEDQKAPPPGSLPPAGKLFGFSEGSFSRTGRDPRLDLGVTAERTVDDLLAAGVNSVRVPISWWNTEPRPGQLDRGYLAVMDRFTRKFERSGGRVLFVLGGPPPWASTKPGDPAAAPRADTDRFFARFAALVAKRYPRAVAIETWNEPNTVFGWRPRPDPTRFTQVHKQAARAIRMANPRAKVVLGGLAAGIEDTEQILRPSRYLEQMYAAGLRPSDYDGLAVHPYPSQRDGKVQTLSGGRFQASLADFRRGYEEHDPDAEIWVTETGVTTSGPGAVSPERQARAIGPLVRTLFNQPRVEAVYVHALYEQATKPALDPTRGFGLLRARGAAQAIAKPAYCALRRLARSPRAFAGCE